MQSAIKYRHVFSLLMWMLMSSAPGAAQAVLQPVAGPEANPLRRMDCPVDGTIRGDDGYCVDVEVYFSTATNTVYWVSQTVGSDTNPGTKVRPWKTISRAAGVLGPGDAVVIRGGTYRETIAPHESGRAGHLITFAAYPGESVVVSGADPLNDGWAASGDSWRHEWTLPLPGVPNKGTVAERPEFRRELVVVDGQVLTPVFARDELVPGTFYVEGPDVAPKAIYLRLPADDSPSGHVIEVGRRSALFLPKNAREDFCGAKFGYYRLVGLTFRHAVNNGNWAAVCSGREGSLLEENTVEWTNGTGIDLQGFDNVMRGNRANDNGMRGVGGRCTRCRIEYNETNHNNWKRHAYGYAASGIKLVYSNETVIRHHVSKMNNGVGIWLDVKNSDNVVENSILEGNVGRGILLEYATVRTLVRNNVIIGTRHSTSGGTGIQVQSASENSIVHNTLVGNEGYGVWIRLSSRAENGHNHIYNNLFIANGAAGRDADSEIRVEGESVGHARSNTLDGNVYWPHPDRQGTFSFRVVGGPSYRGDDLTEWQSLTNGDGNASILDPRSPHVVDRSSPNGWHLAPNSQAADRAVVLPEGIRVPTDIYSSTRPPGKADVGAYQRSPAAF